VSWKQAKQMANNSLLVKICYGSMFWQGITGNDDVLTTDLMYSMLYIYFYLFTTQTVIDHNPHTVQKKTLQASQRWSRLDCNM
jgi:hypothetical protein